ncbi:dicarboxylate/amino acid:cation symporter, partial [Bacillus sp. mrc49]
MKSFFKNYRSSLILLTAIIIGGIAGVVFGEKTSVIQPLGDLFLNLMFTIIVPLVFFSIASAIANMSGMNRLGKIMGSIVIVFLTTAALAAVIGFIGTTIINPLEGTDTTAIKELMENSSPEEKVEDVSFFSQLVNTVTVSDFPELFSRSNMLQLIVFSVLIGLSTALVGEKARPITEFLTAGTAVMMKVVKIVMYYAPIGLGAYFATIIGQLGPQILEGY